MQTIIDFIRKTFDTQEFIPLHEPRFNGNEKKYLNECIDSTFVSSVGKFVDQFERMFADYVGARYAIAVMNGTAALHLGLKLAGVRGGDEVITQPLTFIATTNAISYCGAQPIFVDVDKTTLGLCAEALESFLQQNARMENDQCVNVRTGRTISACLPMHTFGHPCEIDAIGEICERWGLALVEDAAESLGSTYKGRHTGTFGRLGAFSFNGNKVITGGGGGVIVTDDEELAMQAKHLSTTAKVQHPYEYVHDQIGYNYRLPNLNAALLVAQMEQLDGFLRAKRQLAAEYKAFFSSQGMRWLEQPANSKSNYWLQAVILDSIDERNRFLQATNPSGVMTRPIWRLMNDLEMYRHCQRGNLDNAKWLEHRVVNIPSSVRL